jgi:hypothetical protein
MLTPEINSVKRVNFKWPYEKELQTDPYPSTDFAETNMFIGMSIITGALSVPNRVYKICA